MKMATTSSPTRKTRNSLTSRTGTADANNFDFEMGRVDNNDSNKTENGQKPLKIQRAKQKNGNHEHDGSFTNQEKRRSARLTMLLDTETSPSPQNGGKRKASENGETQQINGEKKQRKDVREESKKPQSSKIELDISMSSKDPKSSEDNDPVLVDVDHAENETEIVETETTNGSKDTQLSENSINIDPDIVIKDSPSQLNLDETQEEKTSAVPLPPLQTADPVNHNQSCKVSIEKSSENVPKDAPMGDVEEEISNESSISADMESGQHSGEVLNGGDKMEKSRKKEGKIKSKLLDSDTPDPSPRKKYGNRRHVCDQVVVNDGTSSNATEKVVDTVTSMSPFSQKDLSSKLDTDSYQSSLPPPSYSYEKWKEVHCMNCELLSSAIEKCEKDIELATTEPPTKSTKKKAKNHDLQNFCRRSSRVATLPQERRKTSIRNNAENIAKAWLCLERDIDPKTLELVEGPLEVIRMKRDWERLISGGFAHEQIEGESCDEKQPQFKNLPRGLEKNTAMTTLPTLVKSEIKADEPPHSDVLDNHGNKLVTAENFCEVKDDLTSVATSSTSSAAVIFQEYVTLIKQAKSLLREWRTYLQRHDIVACSDLWSEIECDGKDGERKWIRLFETQVLAFACGGGEVKGSVGTDTGRAPSAVVDAHGNTTVFLEDKDSGKCVPYVLRVGECAIVVHYKDFESSSDRWLLLPFNEEEDLGKNHWFSNDEQVNDKTNASSAKSDGNPPKSNSEYCYKDGFIVTPNGRFDVGMIVPWGSHLASTDALKHYIQCTSESKASMLEHLGNGKVVDDLVTVKREHIADSKKGNSKASTKKRKVSLEKAVPSPPTKPKHSPSKVTTSPKTATAADGVKPTLTKDTTKAKSRDSSEKKSASKDNVKEESNLEFTWICTACREAECFTDPSSPLLLCDGKCNRPFHFPCAELLSMPPENEPWLCSDCVQQRHQCAVCKEYGDDDVDVFCCDAKNCGLFFHENCLSCYNVDVQIVEEVVPVETSKVSESEVGDKSQVTVIAKDESSTSQLSSTESSVDPAKITTKEDTRVLNRPKFRCPAHECWTCCDDIPMDESEMPEDCEPSNKAGKKKGKRGKKGKSLRGTFSSLFGVKKERLFRCLDCPIAYHITCIPPCCRFHELALLCHEHSSSSKLPYLDSETSFQAAVEANVDKVLSQLKKKQEKVNAKGKSSATGSDNDEDEEDEYYEDTNPFLPGVCGSLTMSQEDQLIEFLRGDRCERVRRKHQFHYCLPCDFKEEIHSKPPAYTHINANRYDPQNRPKRHPPSDVSCQCKISSEEGTVSCGFNCLNRLSYVECVGDNTLKTGDKNPYWNCDCGPNCGNRGVSKRQFAKCRPMREQGRGWGLITINGVQKGDLVQEYVGEVIDEKTKEDRLDSWSRDHPNDPNFYVMHLEPGWYIDAREVANLARFINHSCDPNCKLVPVNVAGHMRVSIVCIKDVPPGGFLSYDYQFDTKHGEKFVCRCGATTCRGTMKGGKSEEAKAEKKTKKQLLLEAKARVHKDKKFLENLAKSEKARLNLTGLLVPGERKDGSDTVASGLKERYRNDVQQNRIFLWRNARLGADFSSRYWRSVDRKQNQPAQIVHLSSVSCELGRVDVLSTLKE